MSEPRSRTDWGVQRCRAWPSPYPTKGVTTSRSATGRCHGNAKPDAGRLAAGIPSSNFWASDPRGVNQVGCVYAAQGFEARSGWAITRSRGIPRCAVGRRLPRPREEHLPRAADARAERLLRSLTRSASALRYSSSRASPALSPAPQRRDALLRTDAACHHELVKSARLEKAPASHFASHRRGRATHVLVDGTELSGGGAVPPPDQAFVSARRTPSGDAAPRTRTIRAARSATGSRPGPARTAC